MKYILVLLGLTASLMSYSQRVVVSTNQGISNTCLVGNSSYHVSECIYTNSELGQTTFLTTQTSIKKIAVSIASLPAAPQNLVNNYKVYMKNVSPGNSTFPFTGAFSLDGYTEVFSGSIQPTNADLALNSGWFIINLNPTVNFHRDFGKNLQVMFIRTDNVSRTSGFFFNTSKGNDQSSVAFSSREYNGTTEPVSGVTTLTQTFKRPAMQFLHEYDTDAGLYDIIFPISSCHNTPKQIKVVVGNEGVSPIPPGGVQVTLKVSGANAFTSTEFNTRSIPARSVGGNPGRDTISFSGINLDNVGENLDTAIVVLTGDESSYNDSITASNYTAVTRSELLSNVSIEENVEANQLSTFPFVQVINGGQLWTIQEDTFTNVFLNGPSSLTPNPASTGNKYFLFNTTITDGDPSTEGWVSRLYSNCVQIPATETNFTNNISFFMSHDNNLPIEDLDDSLYLIISTDRGLSWSTLDSYGRLDLADPSLAETPVWKLHSVTIPSEYEGKTVQIGFKGVSKMGNVIGLDDINIFRQPTPAKLLSFDARLANGNTTDISWTVNKELNISHYVVERSTDNKNYRSIGEVAAYNNSSISNRYSFTDNNPVKGINYYRLRIVSTGGGKTEYSEVKNVKTLNTDEMVVSPNPVQSTMSVYFDVEKAENIVMTVRDMSGKKVLSHQAIINQGASRVEIPVERLNKGNYILSTTINGASFTRRIIKM